MAGTSQAHPQPHIQLIPTTHPLSVLFITTLPRSHFASHQSPRFTTANMADQNNATLPQDPATAEGAAAEDKGKGKAAAEAAPQDAAMDEDDDDDSSSDEEEDGEVCAPGSLKFTDNSR